MEGGNKTTLKSSSEKEISKIDRILDFIFKMYIALISIYIPVIKVQTKISADRT